MVSLNWCFKQKEGIKAIEPNENLAESYIKMAENALGTMNREAKHNLVFSISACYYSTYYSLYAIMGQIGIKCEIHSCSIKFMETFLSSLYTKSDEDIIKKAFKLRNIAQYYVDRIIDKEDVDFIIKGAPDFVAKSKEILSKLNETHIKEIRQKVVDNK
ncbi:MAG: HEPN domain-containing protein [archaeon]